ncbi:MAG: Recombination protein [Chlorobi bacterium]|nr:Recombination protein [Chlorobiota bacterium]
MPDAVQLSYMVNGPAVHSTKSFKNPRGFKMITRVEIDGFRMFHDAALEIAPFQAIIGAGDAGKSNFFEVLALLSALAESDLLTAFHMLHGEPREMFTLREDGSFAGCMRLAVEMLTASDVEDAFGARGEIRYTRMRYEVEIARRMDARGVERLYVMHEALQPIQRSDDPWARRHIVRGREFWLPTLKTGRTVPFISTRNDDGIATIYLHQDGRGGDMAAVAQGAERTVLSTIANTEFPHAFAAREEMRSWRTLALDPEAIRSNRSTHSHSFVGSDGGNLGPALARIHRERPGALDRIARDIAELHSSIRSIGVDDRDGRGRPGVRVTLAGGHQVSPGMLSGGALRLMALVVLRNDPDADGVLCIEEPENGLDPHLLRIVAPYLRRMSTDFTADPSADERPRQIIAVTHSTELVRELVRGLAREEDGPVHDLPQLLFVHAPRRGAERRTEFARIRPSEQLELGLAGEIPGHTLTLAEVEGEMTRARQRDTAPEGSRAF